MHTIIIEADIQPSKSKHISESDMNTWRHRITTTCGDSNITWSTTKHIDPALCLYSGARFLCVMDNKSLDEQVPRGNGTMCRFRSLKLKSNQTSYGIKMYHGRKVRTVNARDVEHIVCEIIDNSDSIKNTRNKLSNATSSVEKNDFNNYSKHNYTQKHFI